MIVVSKDSPLTAAKTLSYLDIELIEGLVGPYSRHMDDYDYFYQNIRENAELRVNAFLEKSRNNSPGIVTEMK